MTVTAHHIASLSLPQAFTLGTLTGAAGRALHDDRGFLYDDTARRLGLAM